MIKILYLLTTVLVVLSLINNKAKTKQAFIKAWKSFNNLLPLFLGVLILVGLILAIFNAQLISKIIGSESGFLGTFFASILGTLAMIPSFVALPMAQMLVENGAGYMQIGAFISALFWVQLASLPIEIKYFGKKVAITRNILAFLSSFVVAFVIGFVMEAI
jgi:uncharacterized membrane protein YraQ (UPF0718 family)